MNRVIDQAKKDLVALFDFDVNEPLITLIDTRREMDLVLGRKTESWMVGTAFGFRNIYIFNPAVFPKVSGRKAEDFWQVLRHEYCHIYIKQMVKTDRPIWLNEGFACYFAGQSLAAKTISEKELLNFSEYYHRGGKGVYFIGQFWVELLIKQLGIKKFVQLIKSFEPNMTVQNFSRKFKKVYGFNANKKGFSALLR